MDSLISTLMLVGYALVLATAAAAFVMLSREAANTRGRFKHALKILKYSALYAFAWVAFEVALKLLGVANFTLFDFPIIIVSYFVVLGLALAAKAIGYNKVDLD